MTARQFFARLRQTPRTWTVDTGDLSIRSGDHCPITAVYALVAPAAAEGLDANDWAQAAEAMRLDDILGGEIVRAADPWMEMEFDRRLRCRIMRACGL